MDRIDDESYQQGRDAFVDGTSLREVAEQFMAADFVDAPPSDEAREQREHCQMSLVLGFFDAAFDRLRGIER